MERGGQAGQVAGALARVCQSSGAGPWVAFRLPTGLRHARALPRLQVKAVREAAAAAGAALVSALNPHATRAAVALLLAGAEQGLKWQARAGALGLLGKLASKAPAVSAGPARGRECGGACCLERGGGRAPGLLAGRAEKAPARSERRAGVRCAAAVAPTEARTPLGSRFNRSTPSLHCHQPPQDCARCTVAAVPLASSHHPMHLCPSSDAGVCALHGGGGAPRLLPQPMHLCPPSDDFFYYFIKSSARPRMQEFAHCMVAVVPRVSECMVDIRQEVREACAQFSPMS